MQRHIRDELKENPRLVARLLKLSVATILMSTVVIFGFIFTSPKQDCLTSDIAAVGAVDVPLQCWMDGCSAVPDFDFGDCCNQHDVAYWLGGTHDDRLKADTDLSQCLHARGHPFLAKLYFAGVRVGGVPWLPTEWRWGYGWPFTQGNRGYR